MNEFKKELEQLINSKCKENDSNTPDYILAKYLDSCLTAFNEATVLRDEYYNITHNQSNIS